MGDSSFSFKIPGLGDSFDLATAKNAGGISTKAKTDTPDEIKKAGTDFEALLLQQMFKSMWETVPKGDMLSGSKEEGLYRDMLNEALAKDVAENDSIGIRDVIANDIKDINKREKGGK